eukprot:2651119-Pleurochrysis_carterae.AAC.1
MACGACALGCSLSSSSLACARETKRKERQAGEGARPPTLQSESMNTTSPPVPRQCFPIARPVNASARAHRERVAVGAHVGGRLRRAGAVGGEAAKL